MILRCYECNKRMHMNRDGIKSKIILEILDKHRIYLCRGCRKRIIIRHLKKLVREKK